MAISVFELFSVGIGPSSSHTVGPMRAARRFAKGLERDGLLLQVARVKVELFGSLGHTGKGHGSDAAVVMGLLGERPEALEPDGVPRALSAIQASGQLALLSAHHVKFRMESDLVFHRRERLPVHPNGMRFIVYDSGAREIRRREFYSVGGGFVVGGDVDEDTPLVEVEDGALPHAFTSGDQLLEQCKDTGFSISTLMLENEKVWHSEEQIRAGLLERWSVMQACVKRGCEREGILPGGLRVRRRAATIHRRLKQDARGDRDPLLVMDWVNLFALAVNEENAAGGAW